MTHPTIRRRAAQPKFTIIPVDLTRRQRRAIAGMAARDGVSFAAKHYALVAGQLGI
jgi:hypothetical protein